MTDSPTSQRSNILGRGRRALGWGLAFLVGGQLLLLATLEWGKPELLDPEYGIRLRHLRTRLREGPPHQPLVLVMGSSRVAMGLRPKEVSVCQPGSPQSAIVFNFGLMMSGPMMELMCLRRLLDDGIRPDWLLIEVWPGTMVHEHQSLQEKKLDVLRLRGRDLPVLARYYARPNDLGRTWFEAQLLPWYSHRFTLLNHYVPRWYPEQLRNDLTYRDIDEWGWERLPGLEPGRRREVSTQKGLFVKHAAPIDLVSHRCLCDMLALCRQERISASLLYMPEGSDVSSPSARKEFEDYLQRLNQQFAVWWINARDSMADEHLFDGAHLAPDSAVLFSQRFDEEVMQPYCSGHLALPLLITRKTITAAHP